MPFYIVIDTIPQGVFGGISIVLFGLVAVSGARIWVENKIDFKDSRTMLIAGVPSKFLVFYKEIDRNIQQHQKIAVIIGAGMRTTLRWGNFQLDGIGLSTYAAIFLNQFLQRRNCSSKNQHL